MDVMDVMEMCVLHRFAWGRTFTSDSQVARAVALLLLVMVPYVVFDGVQTVVTGIMRGQGRQVPLLLSLSSLVRYCDTELSVV
jgi:Na+-driven multidrug efflux pump